MLPPKRDHRLRVLENLARLAGESARTEERKSDQLRMPLIVEVKQVVSLKQPARRGRRRSAIRQLDLDNL